MSHRIRVLKTYKLYVGGQFPRTESGRTSKVQDRSHGRMPGIIFRKTSATNRPKSFWSN